MHFGSSLKKGSSSSPTLFDSSNFPAIISQHEIYSDSITHCFVAIVLVLPTVKTGLNAAILPDSYLVGCSSKPF